MTRGKIIYIDRDERVFSSIEFNGDMYPDGNADRILEMFEAGFFTSYNNYESFVIRFNKSHYGYEEELIHPFTYEEERVIDVTENWTDYLYIINNSDREWVINDKNGASFLDKRTLGIVRFQQVEKMIHRVLHENAKEFSTDISKEEFVEVLNRLRESSDLVRKVNGLFRDSRDNVECDFCNGAALQISHESTVVFLLRKLMKDAIENIDYFIYELDYGRKYEPGMITDEDGRAIDLSTSEKLYDYLTGEVDKYA